MGLQITVPRKSRAWELECRAQTSLTSFTLLLRNLTARMAEMTRIEWSWLNVYEWMTKGSDGKWGWMDGLVRQWAFVDIACNATRSHPQDHCEEAIQLGRTALPPSMLSMPSRLAS